MLIGLMVVGVAPEVSGETTIFQDIGVSTVATMYPGTDVSHEISAISAVGVNSVRISIKWNLVEPDMGGPLRWGPVDLAIGSALSHGLRVLATLEGPAPAWAQAPGTDVASNGNPPLSPIDWAVFIKKVAQRYLGQISTWEVWNEPNIPRYLIPPTAQNYVPLLKAAYSAIREVDSSAPIITGGTSTDSSGTPDVSFLESLYTLGAREFFDGVAVHPYSFGKPPNFSAPDSVVMRARAILDEHGDSAKKVWITEYGQPTGDGPESVDEKTQGEMLASAITQVRKIPGVGGLFLFNTVDLSSEPSDMEGNFGLYRFDYTPKPALAHVAAALG